MNRTKPKLWETRSGSAPRGFTIVEMLVVVTIIALLTAMVLPSLRRAVRQARSTVCQANLKDLHRSLVLYQDENDGWIPAVTKTSAFRSTDSWTSRLFKDDPAGRGTLVCPDDPWAPLLQANLARAVTGFEGSTSYGLNDFIVSSPDSFLANLGRYRPRRPDSTILIADVGPDTLAAGAFDAGIAELPSTRVTARLVVDDGFKPGEPPGSGSEPWVTGRHLSKINVLTLQGNVRSINTRAAMQRFVTTYYPLGAEKGCTLCLHLELPHYSFAESDAFWWTGPLPVR